MITITGLHKYFNKGSSNALHVLDDINITFPEKGLVTLFGHSGSGKTTLLNVIGLMDTFDSGTIDWNGRVFSKYHCSTFDEIRNKEIGTIFQNYHLIEEENVYDNVAYPLHLLGVTDKNIIDRQVMYALEAVGMDKFKKRNVTMLSGGQQQRVAIARALAKDPKVIIADEPTGNLDHDNTFEVMNIIKKISKDRLVILVSHEEDLVNFYSDIIIEIKDGKIISQKENQKTSLLHKDNRNLYLKDLNFSSSSNQDNIDVKFYFSQEDDKLDLDIVQKGDTYYIKPKDKKKIIVVDENSEVKFVDKSERDFQKELEVTDNDFDLTKIKIGESDCKKRNVFKSLGKTTFNSFFKSKRFFKRSRIAPIVLVLTSFIYAILFPFLGNILHVDSKVYQTSSHMSLQVNVKEERYYVYDQSDSQAISSYQRVKEFLKDDESIVSILPRMDPVFEISTPEYYNHSFYHNFKFYPVDASKYPYNVEYGKKVEADDEVVISRWVVDSILDDDISIVDNIKKPEDLISKTISFLNGFHKIVGISDENSFTIMIPNAQYLQCVERADNASHGYSSTFFVETKEKDIVKKKLQEKFNDELEIIDPLKDGFGVQFANNIKSYLVELTILLTMIIAITLYIILMVRVTLFKKIKEIGVLRSIGAKKSDIRNIFIGEMIAMTTVYGALVYLLTIGLNIYLALRYGIYNFISVFATSPLFLIAGLVLIYLIAIGAALIPVSILLRKTPIEIIKKYDI